MKGYEREDCDFAIGSSYCNNWFVIENYLRNNPMSMLNDFGCVPVNPDDCKKCKNHSKHTKKRK
jgi:hypothetical protein